MPVLDEVVLSRRPLLGGELPRLAVVVRVLELEHDDPEQRENPGADSFE